MICWMELLVYSASVVRAWVYSSASVVTAYASVDTATGLASSSASGSLGVNAGSDEIFEKVVSVDAEGGTELAAGSPWSLRGPCGA